MSNNQLVSCIVTTYKRQPDMVIRAVKSILNQTYVNIEVIVVDDSPSSYTYRNEVERRVISLNNKIKYIKHEHNKGACAARNTGIIHSSGEFVAFLDDDDEWLPTKLEKQIKLFDNPKVGLVYCRQRISKSGNLIEPQNELFRGSVYNRILERNFIGSTSFVVMRKSIIKEAGCFDEQMPSAQDLDLWIRVLKLSECDYVDEALVIYYVHGNECITANPTKKLIALKRLNQKYWKDILENKRVMWKRIIVLTPFFIQTGSYSEAIRNYIKAVRIKPLYIKENIIMFLKCIKIFVNNVLLTKKER